MKNKWGWTAWIMLCFLVAQFAAPGLALLLFLLVTPLWRITDDGEGEVGASTQSTKSGMKALERFLAEEAKKR